MASAPLSEPRLWVVAPAAGASRRMGASTPKQYLPLAGRTVLEWALRPFLEREDCAAIVVVLAADDARWRTLPAAAEPRIMTAAGGAERLHSVQAGLSALASLAHAADWVLVHDAARPCLTAEDLAHLIDKLRAEEVGGLLATPLVDTLKRADGADRVLGTLPRDLLWRALTPQMFRFGVLRRAVQLAVDHNIAATDESQAVEALGLRPHLIAGSPDNLKITVPADLQRAERILEARMAVGCRL